MPTLASVGLKIGQHVILYCPNNLDKLTKLFTPAAEGISNSGFIVPDPDSLNNEYTNILFKSLLLQDLSGLNHWITLIHYLVSYKIPIFTIVDSKQLNTYIIQNLQLRRVNVLTWTVPCPIMKTSYTRGMISEVHQVTLYQLMQYLGFETVSDGLNAIIQIALFGFPLHEKILDSWDLTAEEIVHYVRSRLIHGKLDQYWGSLHYKASVFIPDTQDEPTDKFEELYKSAKNPYRVAQLSNRLSMELGKKQFLGNSSVYWQTLAEQNMLKHPSPKYLEYLKKPFGVHIGPQEHEYLYKTNRYGNVSSKQLKKGRSGIYLNSRFKRFRRAWRNREKPMKEIIQHLPPGFHLTPQEGHPDLRTLPGELWNPEQNRGWDVMHPPRPQNGSPFLQPPTLKPWELSTPFDHDPEYDEMKIYLHYQEQRPEIDSTFTEMKMEMRRDYRDIRPELRNIITEASNYADRLEVLNTERRREVEWLTTRKRKQLERERTQTLRGTLYDLEYRNQEEEVRYPDYGLANIQHDATLIAEAEDQYDAKQELDENLDDAGGSAPIDRSHLPRIRNLQLNSSLLGYIESARNRIQTTARNIGQEMDTIMGGDHPNESLNEQDEEEALFDRLGDQYGDYA